MVSVHGFLLNLKTSCMSLSHPHSQDAHMYYIILFIIIIIIIFIFIFIVIFIIHFIVI